ncbi:MAG: hypothetical protein RR053_06095 [Evtepia sp.]
MKPTQAFNDGIVLIYDIQDVSKPGDAPKERLTQKGMLRYKQRTVGYGRYYAAMQANVQISMLLRVPRVSMVSEQDIAVPTDGRQYLIKLIQYPEDTIPPVMDLTLERLEHDYGLP